MFFNKNSEIFIPNNENPELALSRTTHLSIGAHPDDIEIMSYHGISECFGSVEKWFTGCVVTNGAGSPRDGIYKNFSDEEMQIIRRKEQKKAAVIGEYSAQVFLDYSSDEVKEKKSNNITEDIKRLIQLTKPKIIYTHNPADKHNTHVAVLLRVISALRESESSIKPYKIYGCEVWRDLDWLPDEYKIPLEVDKRENIANSLVGVFDSQICGGKRYDIAIYGRRKCNATFFKSHFVDSADALTFALDLTELAYDSKIEAESFIENIIDDFKKDVVERIRKLK